MDQDLIPQKISEDLATRYDHLIAELHQWRDWVNISELQNRLPWLTPQILSRLIQHGGGSISSTAKGYLLTARLTPAQNKAADTYLRNRIRTQTKRLIQRRKFFHNSAHQPHG